MQTHHVDGRADTDPAWLLAFAAWFVASVATLGSLFFSEVMHLPPCSLCWYQRVFMFPLLLILPFGLFPFDRSVIRAVLPLTGIGGLVAALQLLIVQGIVPERVAPCRQGVSCSETVVEWFGFVTIPLLSLAAFVAIGVLLILALARSPS